MTTKKQDLLIEYLVALKASKATILYILVALNQGEAISEMLDYIIKTKENDLAKLSSTASKISQKYTK